MLILLLVSQLSAPVADKVTWVKPDDYPMQYIEAGRSFEIDLRATIQLDGTAKGCSAEKSGGDVAFDKYNCGLLLRRVKFKPATDSSGKAIVGVFRTSISWIVDYRKLKPRAGDIELTVAKLPAGLTSPTSVHVALAVDKTGKPSDCAGNGSNQNAALLKTACAQLVKSYRAIPARLASDELVPSVQTAKVSFFSASP